jgi:predicted small lipoprotein YifL
MRTFAVLVGVVLVLSGCGQKGPLYLPDSKGAVVTSAPAAATPAPAPSTPQPKKPTDPSDPDQNAPPAK